MVGFSTTINALLSVDAKSQDSRLAIVEYGIIVAVDGKREKAGIFLGGS